MLTFYGNYPIVSSMERGPNDLEEIIERKTKQVKFLQEKCRQAGARIKDLEEINAKHQELVGSLYSEKGKRWDEDKE